MKLALVTGGAGFIGRHMVKGLLAAGWDVHSVDLEPTWVTVDWSGPAHLHVIQDVLRYFAVPTAFPFDLVVHAAARAPHRAAIDGQPAATVYNQLLDAALFEWAIRTRQRRVLYLSSCAAYPTAYQVPGRVCAEDLINPTMSRGAPPDAYGWEKLTGERMAEQARAAGVPVTVVRPFSGYGEDQSEDFPFGAFVARARRREDPFLIWGDGRQVRDWIHISDLVAGSLAVVEADVREPVNLGTGRGVSMDELARMVCATAGYEPAIEHRPAAPAGVAYRVADTTRMRAIYEPKVTLEEGVARTVATVGA